MNKAEREQQILRVKATSLQPEPDEALEQTLRVAVLEAVKTALEKALDEEVKAELTKLNSDRPRRSGYFERGLDTQYGHVRGLRVPKLRRRNGEREWQILQRYQRGLGNLMNWLCCLYVMGLSLRDLQEALYFLIGHVLSRTAVNKVTLAIQNQLNTRRLSRLSKTPKMLLVDGVWVDIQYTGAEFKEDRSGHIRQCREAEERWFWSQWLCGKMALMRFCTMKLPRRRVKQSGVNFLSILIERGLETNSVHLVVSDGTLGLPKALQKNLPNTQQQRCITHKVRGLEPYLSYAQLPSASPNAQTLKTDVAKRQRRFEITSEAYQIYEADSKEQAQQRLQQFILKWEPLEPKAVQVFQRDLDLTFTFYEFDHSLHRHIRTTNQLERLFREFRAKSDEIGAFPHETSCLTVFFLVLERDHAKHARKSVANK